MLSYIKSVIGRRRHSTGASRAQAVLDRIRANWANTPQTPESTSRQRVRAWSRSNAKKIRAARKAEALTLKRERSRQRSRQRSLAPFYGAADPEEPALDALGEPDHPFSHVDVLAIRQDVQKDRGLKRLPDASHADVRQRVRQAKELIARKHVAAERGLKNLPDVGHLEVQAFLARWL